MALPKEPQSPSRERLFPEKHKIVERPSVPDVEDIEKVEAVAGGEVSLPQPVTDDSGAVIVDTPAPQQVSVTLPLSEDEIVRGLGYKVTNSIRWLAEWCGRVLKIFKSGFRYQSKR